MSIISLKTLAGQNAFDFNNHFREGIKIKKGATIQLLNLTINKEQGLLVDVGNNVFYWRIGNAQSYLNHKIIIPPGSYSSEDLADMISFKLNQSTLLGQYENTWKCNFVASTGTGTLDKFLIDYGQNTPPPETTNVYSEYALTKPGGASQLVQAIGNTFSAFQFIDNGTTDSIIAYGATIVGEKGIFSNGGFHETNVFPSEDTTTYGRAMAGWSRLSMVKPQEFGIDETNVNSHINFGVGGAGVATCDGYIEVVQAGAGNAIINVYQLTANGGGTYPNAGWYNMNQRYTGDIMALLPTLNFGTDAIQLRVHINGNLNQQYIIAHDTAQDGLFINETIVITSGAGTFSSTIKESFYPLIPITMSSGGVAGEKSRPLIAGVYDTTIKTPYLLDLAADYTTDMILSDNAAQGLIVYDQHELIQGYHNYSHMNHESGQKFNSQLGAPLNLMYWVAMGIQLPADYVNGGGTIPNANFPPAATNDATADSLLGYNAGYFFATPAAGITLTSDNQINFDIEEPSLIVELPDFNIKSYNGSTGDIIKAISLVPREELATNDTQGTLHYAQQFSVPISLNVESDQTIYQLRARLRDSEGRLETSLRAPTQIIMYLNNDANSSPMDKMVEQMKSVLGNKQGLEISQSPVINSYIM